jgi:hypothetical protein
MARNAWNLRQSSRRSAHRALHRMAVVIEADREQFVLIELIHR